MIVFRTGGRLHSGIVGQSLTLFVEYGLFVVGIAVNMQVFPDHIPKGGFFSESGRIYVQRFPNFSRLPRSEIFNDSVVFLTGAILQKGYPDSALGEPCRLKFPALGVMVLDGRVVHRENSLLADSVMVASR